MATVLPLFAAGFLGILNETVPAGLLPEIARSLRVSESAAGQIITVYAIATALTAIPLNALLRRYSRRALLVGSLVAFAICNLVPVVSTNYVLILAARIIGGVGAGLIWSNIGGYAARVSPPALRGRAVALALAGTPIALAIGLPLGTFLGAATGWQSTFALTAVLSVLVAVWTLVSLPSLPVVESAHIPFRQMVRQPGVSTVLWVVAGFLVAHNLVYTYIGSLIVDAGMADQIQWVLATFGVAALLSVWATGRLLQPYHRTLTIVSAVAIGGGLLVLCLFGSLPALLYVGVAAWGFGFGGCATLFITAATRAAGTDDVQSAVVTVFNVSIAIGGAAGGILLAIVGTEGLLWSAVAVMAVATITVLKSTHGFPTWKPATSTE
ncbi:MFS transporter [Subtercola sp. RTI3]|uniref:MFS transporter n=1 Tax=Subtercola sp. RTI3 TaxID=3048639 RepID=UPI002B239CE7|nr:MFS transporter [Subtercola sp. RTI3]MEA9985759.1 MFS transporter [Subtercola sp. RTI3]